MSSIMGTLLPIPSDILDPPYGLVHVFLGPVVPLQTG